MTQVYKSWCTLKSEQIVEIPISPYLGNVERGWWGEQLARVGAISGWPCWWVWEVNIETFLSRYRLAWWWVSVVYSELFSHRAIEESGYCSAIDDSLLYLFYVHYRFSTGGICFICGGCYVYFAKTREWSANFVLRCPGNIHVLIWWCREYIKSFYTWF